MSIRVAHTLESLPEEGGENYYASQNSINGYDSGGFDNNALEDTDDNVDGLSLNRVQELGGETVELARKKHAKQLSFMFSVDGRGFERTFTSTEFVKLSDEEKVLIGLGQVHTSSYSCFDTEEKKFDHVVKLFSKGKTPAESSSSCQEVGRIIASGIEEGLIQHNGNGRPELTSEGVDKLNGKNSQETTEHSSEIYIEIGGDDLLDEISAEDPFSEEAVKLKRRFASRPYELLKLLVESNGKIKSENKLFTVVRELTSNIALAEVNRQAARYLGKRGLITDESKNGCVDITITGKGIATYRVLERDEEGLVQKTINKDLVPGGRSHEILGFLSGGCFEVEKGSGGWIFGKNSKGNVIDRIYDDIQGTRDGVQRTFYRLIDRGYIETIVINQENKSARRTVNARLSEKGIISLNALEEMNQVEY